jgi:predicted ATPase
VWWTELAPLAPGADPTPAVAAVLGIRQPTGAEGAGTLADVVAAGIGARRLLLVLDNCEQLVDASAALVERLLRECPGLTVLATSREALAVEGEVVWPVAGLAHPRAGDADPCALARYEAVALFVERTRAVLPGFAVTARNAAAVAAITARLDGLPLALELAAAQTAALGPEHLATRLDDAFAVLTRGRRTVPPRHRTLRALLDWSYDLLGPDERALLARLSVFGGPFPLEAVERVCAPRGDGPAVAALGRLVEQSLVDVREEGNETRYWLLETVRQYGRARLAETPAAARLVRARHAAWVAARAAAAAPATWSAALQRTVRALEGDAAEIRAALDWAAGPAATR